MSERLANTLGLQSRAQRVFRARTAQEVLAAAAWASERGLPLIPLGAGSNVVLPSALNAVIVYIADDSVTILRDTPPTVVLRVGAGKNWHQLVRETVDAGYCGLENLALIPGCVGAAPVQNIGAYGRELAPFVERVHGVDLDRGRGASLSPQDCEFGYRDSVFKNRLRDRFVITAVDFRLSREVKLETSYPRLAEKLAAGVGPATPRTVCNAVIAIRRERLPDPEQEPNVGSFFKNPLVGPETAARLDAAHAGLPVHPQADGRCKLSAAWLIDSLGLRGKRHGGAAVSERHALVLVNRGGATQEDVLKLAELLQRRVSERFGVSLEIEPRIYPGE